MRELLKRRPVHGDAATVDGRTIAKIAADDRETPGQEVVVPIETADQAVGGLRSSTAHSRPEGCVMKLAGHERRYHTGPARVFDPETAARGGERAARSTRATWS